MIIIVCDIEHKNTKINVTFCNTEIYNLILKIVYEKNLYLVYSMLFKSFWMNFIVSMFLKEMF